MFVTLIMTEWNIIMMMSQSRKTLTFIFKKYAMQLIQLYSVTKAIVLIVLAIDPFWSGP